MFDFQVPWATTARATPVCPTSQSEHTQAAYTEGYRTSERRSQHPILGASRLALGADGPYAGRACSRPRIRSAARRPLATSLGVRCGVRGLGGRSSALATTAPRGYGSLLVTRSAAPASSCFAAAAFARFGTRSL